MGRLGGGKKLMGEEDLQEDLHEKETLLAWKGKVEFHISLFKSEFLF